MKRTTLQLCGKESKTIETKYEVLRFLEHGERCRMTMDYVQGELLIHRVQRENNMEKEQLLKWFFELAEQMEQFYRCNRSAGYRYLNPYSILITRGDEVLLLDLEAESNDCVLKQMQKRAVRDHFVKPVINIRENARLTKDLYGYGKTLQFLMASIETDEPFSKHEERQLERIAETCLGETKKRAYESWKQIRRELPRIKGERMPAARKAILLAVIVLLVVTTALFLAFGNNGNSGDAGEYLIAENNTTPQQSVQLPLAEMIKLAVGEATSTEAGEKKLRRFEWENQMMEQYFLKNTSQGNQRVIEKSEAMECELLRYLAAAYEREEMWEDALDAYERICQREVREDYLCKAYFRNISILYEMDLKEKAEEKENEMLTRFPEWEEREEYQELQELKTGKTGTEDEDEASKE